MEKELIIIGGIPYVAWSEVTDPSVRKYQRFDDLDSARQFMDFIDLMEVSREYEKN